MSFILWVPRDRLESQKNKEEFVMNTDKTYAEKIASEYAPKETRKVVALRKLDNRAKRPANIFAYTFGIIMALLLGVGMCLSMKVIGDGSTTFMILGIIVGVIGIVGVSVNYPIYKRILANSMNKYSVDILTLAREIAEE
jgi:uncharacterized protein (UPF0335 family)